jgi:hypothetical protein
MGRMSIAKGAGFERGLCKSLSLWLSHGEKKDLFSRNAGSGGAYTSNMARGNVLGTGGDVMAAHPVAYEFLQYFFVEAKFWQDLQLESALWGKGELNTVIKKVEKQAEKAERIPMLITKQNFRPTLMFVPGHIGSIFTSLSFRQIMYHALWRGRWTVFIYDDVLKIDADKFIARIKERET